MINGYAQELGIDPIATPTLIAVGGDGVLLAMLRHLEGGEMARKPDHGHSIPDDAVGFSAANAIDAGFPPKVLPIAAKRRQMAEVKTQHTAPEMTVRRAMHARGLRFRLHRRDLPGRPDIVLPKHQTAVFVHGCYWHGCVMCDRGIRRPKTNAEFWSAKLAENRRRDDGNITALKGLGWQVSIIWECETRNPETLCEALDRLPFLVPSKRHHDE